MSATAAAVFLQFGEHLLTGDALAPLQLLQPDEQLCLQLLQRGDLEVRLAELLALLMQPQSLAQHQNCPEVTLRCTSKSRSGGRLMLTVGMG